ncbi:hypothetical protein O1611_g30 [Lasiodiplodia mahajangana]|uniref:Uncharacterized protein n=1 Tax=Lasiodiplodia mahajangana TaxID=1108764 RepID=A0ACC2K1F4_9PEZI|nr:hypothetical protein O1611_g30 [Lasiodiplodia mahajangana]
MSQSGNGNLANLLDKEASLQRELQELEAAARIRDLKRRVEVLKKAQLPFDSEAGSPSNRQDPAQVSELIPLTSRPSLDGHVGDPECQVMASHETPQQAPDGKDTSLDPIHSKGGPSVSTPHDRDVDDIDMIVSPGAAAILPQQSVIPGPACAHPSRPSLETGIYGAGNSTTRFEDRGFDLQAITKLKYYCELDDYEDNDAELLCLDMDLEQLYNYAGILEDNPEKDIGQVMRLGRVLCFIFSRTGSLDEIQKAVDKAEEAVAATGIDTSNYAPFLRGLIVMLMKKYESTHLLEDLDRAILRAEEMLTITPPFHRDRLARLDDLVNMKTEKCIRTGELDEARDAASMAAAERANLRKIIRDIGVSFERLESFVRTDDLDALQIAVQHAETTLEAWPSHLNRALILSIHSKFLYFRFKRLGNIDDFQLLMQSAIEALHQTPRDDPMRPERLSELAIQRCEEAVEAMPHDDEGRPHTLGLLSVSLIARFLRNRDFQDLERAIKQTEEAIEPSTHLDGSTRGIFTCNLANWLQLRFLFTDDPNDILASTQKCEEAIEVLPCGSPDRAIVLGDTAIAFGLRCACTGNLDDLNSAIEKAEEAVKAMPENHPERARLQAVQGFLHQYRFMKFHEFKDIELAIERFEEAVEATPKESREIASRRNCLANCFTTKSKFTNDRNDAERCVSEFIKTLGLPTAAPRDRMTAAVLAVEELARNQEWAKICDVAEIAVKVLPTVALRQLRQDDQQRIVTEFSSFATIATAAALETKKNAYYAVQLLEVGRSIMAGLRFEIRTDLTNLKNQHKEMAEKFERLRDILDSPTSSEFLDSRTGGSFLSAPTTTQRHNASFEFDKIINQIRDLPGFKGFLQPTQADKLMAAASMGPIVLINVASHRCDALLRSKIT